MATVPSRFCGMQSAGKGWICTPITILHPSRRTPPSANSPGPKAERLLGSRAPRQKRPVRKTIPEIAGTTTEILIRRDGRIEDDVPLVILAVFRPGHDA